MKISVIILAEVGLKENPVKNFTGFFYGKNAKNHRFRIIFINYEK
jgi:hypothetical protein